MTTSPSTGTPRSEDQPHQQRSMAESFGENAERYDRTRPRYPDDLVNRIVAASPGPDFLDVGIGTGFEARQFQAAGCRVLGVDPDARMTELARRTGIEVEVSTFEAWDPAGRTFDAVIAGMAWHWVDPVAGAAQAARVLRPGGRLAVFWNIGEPPPDVKEAFADVYQQVLPDSRAARFYRQKSTALEGYSRFFGQTVDALRATGEFEEPQEWHFDWEQIYTRDEWLEHLPTLGASSQLAPAALKQVQAGSGVVIDALGGHFTMQYTAAVITTVRTGDIG